ncbi:unnamed protein product [Brachionus calyciflorus]|uniref:Uncharacterized protein n=1 Tax=Brachionus calyciflorus TaxID=104777 RepID=A0A813WRK1_9BILA|nr:unnamed protein product [Brachionus calyciflorus]
MRESRGTMHNLLKYHLAEQWYRSINQKNENIFESLLITLKIYYDNLRNKSDLSNIKNKICINIKNNIDKLFDLSNLSNDELRSRIAAHGRFDELSSLPLLANPARKDSRIMFLTLATVLDIINKKA